MHFRDTWRNARAHAGRADSDLVLDLRANSETEAHNNSGKRAIHSCVRACFGAANWPAGKPESASSSATKSALRGSYRAAGGSNVPAVVGTNGTCVATYQ